MVVANEPAIASGEKYGSKESETHAAGFDHVFCVVQGARAIFQAPFPSIETPALFSLQQVLLIFGLFINVWVGSIFEYEHATASIPHEFIIEETRYSIIKTNGEKSAKSWRVVT